MATKNTFPEHSNFAGRHLGPTTDETATMLKVLGESSLDALIDKVVPESIRLDQPLNLPEAKSEHAAIAAIRERAESNQIWHNFIGQGYYGTILPPVIQRNILENPGWYTAYTPYQAEISQGRLEALLNYQTLICELTGLPVANASLLDEGTAVAEAIAMASGAKPKGKQLLISQDCFSQTIDIVKTRTEPLDIDLQVVDLDSVDLDSIGTDLIGVVCQYPDANGTVRDIKLLMDQVHAAKGLVIVAADILALTLLKPPGELGADIVVGSAQRFGVPMGFGGPHAAYIACADAHKRRLPGRLIGVSKDADGRTALRLSLQTREQHIRREKATSNICTAQVLLAVIAGFYAVYHGRDGLRYIAQQIACATHSLATQLKKAGIDVDNDSYFDTLTIKTADAKAIIKRAKKHKVNLRQLPDGQLGLSLDEESVFSGNWQQLGAVFGIDDLEVGQDMALPKTLLRDENFLNQSVFNQYRTESQLMRYMRRLEGKDIALNWSMIPLGSCTMKLNATSELLPLSWPNFNALHPFVPADQAKGYQTLTNELEDWLAEITGFAAVSLQPNAGSQGEYAGLLAIRRYHRARGDDDRTICLIPTSAHGTNPASAVMVGMKVVAVKCDDEGNIDVEDLKAKAEKHAENLAALMITYPSTHGVFEESVAEICELVHQYGGQVYMDGANMNAQVGLCSPGGIGADVCHLNLHKTFCIPHGGGGPGVGPIGVAEQLVPYLPGHRYAADGQAEGVVAAAPLGSASILTISWMYIAMMGADGLTEATRRAILNANYIANRLQNYFPVLYRGKNGYVAHECIIDLREIKEQTGVDVEDVAKRLIDFGFHAPTMSWPVPGTLMIEPTESEDLEELDRFCEAMIAIHAEIQKVTSGEWDADSNPLKNAPHPAENVTSDKWSHSHSREQAAYPLEWVRQRKFWPAVSRVDNVFGDRNLVCTCEGMDAYSE